MFVLKNKRNFCCISSMNTMRLWLPQIFYSIDQYHQIVGASTHASLCTMIDYFHKKDNEQTDVETECNKVKNILGILAYIM